MNSSNSKFINVLNFWKALEGSKKVEIPKNDVLLVPCDAKIIQKDNVFVIGSNEDLLQKDNLIVKFKDNKLTKNDDAIVKLNDCKLTKKDDTIVTLNECKIFEKNDIIVQLIDVQFTRKKIFFTKEFINDLNNIYIRRMLPTRSEKKFIRSLMSCSIDDITSEESDTIHETISHKKFSDNQTTYDIKNTDDRTDDDFNSIFEFYYNSDTNKSDTDQINNLSQEKCKTDFNKVNNHKKVTFKDPYEEYDEGLNDEFPLLINIMKAESEGYVAKELAKKKKKGWFQRFKELFCCLCSDNVY